MTCLFEQIVCAVVRFKSAQSVRFDSEMTSSFFLFLFYDINLLSCNINYKFILWDFVALKMVSVFFIVVVANLLF